MKNVPGKGVACGKQSYFQEIKFCPTGLTQSPSFSKCQLGLVVTRTDLNKSAKLIPGKTRLTSHQGCYARETHLAWCGMSSFLYSHGSHSQPEKMGYHFF